MQLTGRIGIVTGADSAPGRRIAAALASEGMSLMLLARPPARLHEVADDLASAHDIRCLAATMEVTDPAAVDRVLMHVEQHLGPIDVVVSTVPGVLVEAALETMAARGRGHVVHIRPSRPVVAPDVVRQVEFDEDPAIGVGARLLAALA